MLEQVGPTLQLTPKQRHFAELVVLENYKLVHAWREAYDVSPDTPPTTCRPAASKLASNPRVKAYMDELRADVQAELVRQNTWSKWHVLERAALNLEGATTHKQFSAANSALSLIAELEGLLSRKVEITGNVQVSHMSQLSMEQLQAIADRADALPPADDESVVNVQDYHVED